MAEGLEVTIQYRGAKYTQVAAPATPSSGFAILKRDLAHLRVHSPSQKNVRRVNGSFVLHWPNAGTSVKVVGLANSLHTRWFKLCSDDPEALKLRELLSIESITLKQDGFLIRSTAGAELPSQDGPSGTLADRLARPSTASVPAPSRPPPSIPPLRLPPSAPRLDRPPPPHLKRRMSSGEGPSNQTRQKLDVPETPSAAPLPPHDTQPQPTQPIPSPIVDQPPTEDATKASPQPTPEDTTSPTHVQIPTALKVPETSTTPPLPREPGEMTPRSVLSGPSSTGPGPGSGLGPGLGSGPGPGPGSGPRLTPHHPTLSSTGLSPGSPYAGSNSSGNSHSGDSWARRRDRDRDVNRLTRELWDTRRQLTAMQAREQAILDDLERLGVRPENGGGGADRHGAGSRDALSRLEADLRAERTRRLRAERALSDVERECASPFVVPALFQAFMSISELSN